MSELKDKLSEELGEIHRWRDELRVKIHLAKAEAKERFEKAEGRLQTLEAKLKMIRDESKEDVEDVRKAARTLVGEIKEGYRHVKSLL